MGTNNLRKIPCQAKVRSGILSAFYWIISSDLFMIAVKATSNIFYKYYLTLLMVTVVIFASLTGCDQAPSPTAKKPEKRVTLPKSAPAISCKVDDPHFARIEVAAKEEIDARHIPGAVVLVGHRGHEVYRKAFGQRCLEPQPQPMTVGTIFDIASLTKVVATTTAIMQLCDRGLLRLEAPVAEYWPEFSQKGKASITLQQLLTHTSGLREEINPRTRWSDYQGALKSIAMDLPLHPPGTEFRYSDVNFIVLGEIVRRLSGQDLEVYCAEKIFRPLKMRQTTFKPPNGWQECTAPCNVVNGRLHWGEVQDPTAYLLGGVAGHSGVFSTADDLAIFAQMLLDGGESGGERILSSKAVAAMARPQDIGEIISRRGLGWDIQSPYSKEFNVSFPVESFGHTGYTGTSIWIEPRSKTYLIILTNRLHPSGKGQVKLLRAKIAAAVAMAVPMGQPAGVIGVRSTRRDANKGQ
jgi:CubicO group peptidase (beta-lactamase class C family)